MGDAEDHQPAGVVGGDAQDAATWNKPVAPFRIGEGLYYVGALDLTSYLIVTRAGLIVIDGGDAPDLVLFPQNYEGRDVMARLSVKLNKTVLTNNIDVSVDGGAVSATTPIFGGNTLVTTTILNVACLNTQDWPSPRNCSTPPQLPNN